MGCSLLCIYLFFSAKILVYKLQVKMAYCFHFYQFSN